MKRVPIRNVFAAPLVRGGIARAARVASAGSARVAVLLYHRVRDVEGFSAQMEWLARNASPLTPTAFEAALAAGRAPGPASVLVTFDDGTRDFAELAWPILRRFSIPAVLFVPTAYPDSGRVFWWDALEHALRHTSAERLGFAGETLELRGPDNLRRAWKRLRALVKGAPHARAMERVARALDELAVPPPEPDVLGWDELRRLAAQGVCIAAHTREHPMLPGLEPEAQINEVRASALDIARELGQEPGWFAYPSGHFDPPVRDSVAAAGMRVAFTTVDGHQELKGADPLRLRRIAVSAEESLGAFHARLVRARLRRGPLPELFGESAR
jgi:peptidoglycan/xylan/chitin deacetylase (PgdA/CDA1 family)